jgi:hypothetical protein
MEELVGRFSFGSRFPQYLRVGGSERLVKAGEGYGQT